MSREKHVHTSTSLLSEVGKNCVMSHQLYSRLVGCPQYARQIHHENRAFQNALQTGGI